MSEEITQLANAVEKRDANPSYLDLSEVHNNDDLIALYKHVDRIVSDTSISQSNKVEGQIAWNNIQPPNRSTGISDVYIECSFNMTVNLETAADANAKILESLRDCTFYNDINAALYNTEVNLAGHSKVSQPYIDLAIKRFYDPDFYDSSISQKKCDKNVFVKVDTTTANRTFRISYKCSTPLIHPYFSTKNDIAGINTLTIKSNYNLMNLFAVFDKPTYTANATAQNLTFTVNDLTWRLLYNQINYKKELTEYDTLMTDEEYFIGNDQTKNINSIYNIGVHDNPSAPIVQYLVAINNISESKSTIEIAADQQNHLLRLHPIKAILNGLDIKVNANTNAYSSSNFGDIIHCAKKAGYLGTYDDFVSPKFPAVYGFSSLQTENQINTDDNYRFSTTNGRVDTEAAGVASTSQYSLYCVYLYPALFFSPTGSAATVIHSVGGSIKGMIKSESEIDEYLRLLEQAGYSGGSLWSWLKGLRDKLKKGRYISNIAKNVSSVLSNQGLKNIAGMIPTIGPAISSGIDTAKSLADNVAKKAEMLGYGVKKGEGVDLF